MSADLRRHVSDYFTSYTSFILSTTYILLHYNRFVLKIITCKLRYILQAPANNNCVKDCIRFILYRIIYYNMMSVILEEHYKLQ